MHSPALRLSRQEQAILAHIEYAPDMSAQTVAKATGLKTPTVHYAIRKMKERGVIRQHAFVNPTHLGYMEVAMYFSLIDQAHSQREKLLARIRDHERVVYLGALLGDYHFIVIFLCKQLEDIRSFTLDVFRGAGDVFSDKLVAPRLGLHRFGKKYLNPALKPADPLSFCSNQIKVEIDELDSKLLHEVAHKGFDSLRQVARDLATPLSTVDRRVERMLHTGVIAGFYYSVSEEAIGVQCYRLLILKKGLCESTRKRLFDFCKQHPHITYLIESVGAWDFEIGLETLDQAQVSACVEALYAQCGMRIAWVKTLMEGKSYTCSLYPFKKAPIQKEIPAYLKAS